MKINVIILNNNEFEPKEIENDLKTLQNLVGGFIEIPYICDELGKHNIDIIINEEGKLIDGLRPEIVIVNSETNEVVDLIFGTCIFASTDEEGNTIGLTNDQIEVLYKIFKTDMVLAPRAQNRIMVKAIMI